jgi:hypothetical protein
MDKSIPYLDKSYSDKRKILRKFHFMNSDCYELTNMVKYKILDKINKNYPEQKYDFINANIILKKLLIDGYVVYEKVYDNNKLVNIIELDTLSIKMEYLDGEIIWFLNKGKENSKIFKKEQIIYVLFDNDDFTSFVEMVYMKIVNKTTEWTIKSVIDDVYKNYENNFIKIN